MARSIRNATPAASRSARRWWRGMPRRSEGRSDRSGMGAEPRSDTTRTGALLAPTADAAPRPASSRSCDRPSSPPLPLRRAASTRPPTRSAHARRPSAGAWAGTGNRSSGSHVGAVCGRADQGGPANRRHEGLDVSTIYEGENASAKTRAHDPGAVAAGDAPRLLDQCVHRRCRHLAIIAKALVRLLHQSPQLVESATPQPLTDLPHTRDLGVDVTATLGVERLRLAAPLVVRGVGQGAMLAGIDHADPNLPRQCHGLQFDRRAVEG